MRLQACLSVVRRDLSNIQQRLLELAAHKRKNDGHDSARYGSQNQDVCNMRKPGDASHRHDELYVSCTHTACNIEQKEDKATNNARGKRTQQLPPSAKNKVQHKAEPKRGKCNKVRNPS